MRNLKIGLGVVCVLVFVGIMQVVGGIRLRFAEDDRRERLAMQLALSKYDKESVIYLLGKPDGDRTPTIQDWKADTTAFYWMHQGTSSISFGFDKSGKMVGYFYVP